MIAEHGLHTFSMVSVPLYDSLGPDCRAWVIRETEMRVVVAQVNDCTLHCQLKLGQTGHCTV